MNVWTRSILAAAISGAANATATGAASAALGIDSIDAIKLMVATAVMGAITGVSTFLAKSPLPPTEKKR